jgi:3-oxoacyl-[acyl-carrier-protein] synthase-3
MHYVHQDGKVVFKQAIGGMADVSGRLLSRNGVSPDEIKLLIPHQANYRIIDSVARKLNLKPEQVMVNIQKYGNTTAATIPMAMSEAWEEGKLDPGDRIILSAFGAGFTWGSLLMTWTMEK